MFKWLHRNRKIKKYAKHLPLELKRDYGYKKFYSKAQVDKIIKRTNIGIITGNSITDNCYAYAMFCSPKEFKDIHSKAGEHCDYASMRMEVSNCLFSGATNFTMASLILAASHVETSFLGGADFGGGGDFGGDGDSGGGD